MTYAPGDVLDFFGQTWTVDKIARGRIIVRRDLADAFGKVGPVEWREYTARELAATMHKK